jgi:pimeloyl-ACP methyl ester carboxylesterase
MVKKIGLLLCTLSFAFPLALSANSLDFYHARFLRQKKQRTHSTKSHVTEFTLLQKIDPKDPNSPQFSQRYFLDASLATDQNSPVFFYLCGEATCDPSQLGGSTTEHAARYHGYMVALEHRYYGISQPFPTLSTENLRYLTVENAIEDAANFQRVLQSQLNLTGPWFVIGGSYAGALSAYYRLKHPELVAGSLSSSGPVMALANFELFDKHVTESAGPDCAPLMRQVSQTVENNLNNPSVLQAIKAQFQAEKITDGTDFLYLVADMGAMAIQYGYRDSFCAGLKQGDPVAAYAAFTRGIFLSWKMTALDDSVEGAFNTDPKTYEGAFGLRQWLYQSCREFGFWQNAYPDPNFSVRSKLINPEYHQAMCRRLFGIQTPVDTRTINDNFYEPLLTKASNILFTNGSRDPWSELSITEANKNDTNPKTEIYDVINGAHCDDLGVTDSSNSASLLQAKQRFDQLVADTLKQ